MPTELQWQALPVKPMSPEPHTKRQAGSLAEALSALGSQSPENRAGWASWLGVSAPGALDNQNHQISPTGAENMDVTIFSLSLALRMIKAELPA